MSLRDLLIITALQVLVACCSSSVASGQANLSDAEQVEVIRSVLLKEVERKPFVTVSKFLVSGAGIEGLSQERIAAGLPITLLSNAEFERRTRSTTGDYLIIGNINVSDSGGVVTVIRLHVVHSCWGMGEQSRQTITYDVNRLPSSWSAELIRPSVNFTLTPSGPLSLH